MLWWFLSRNEPDQRSLRIPFGRERERKYFIVVLWMQVTGAIGQPCHTIGERLRVTLLS
jgi:hypothetical protein